MTRRSLAVLTVLATTLALLMAAPAAADHTDPDSPLSPTPESGRPLEPGNERGAGEWDYHATFPPNPSSDHWYFTKNGKQFVTSGTLGGGPLGHVGQRILQLTDDAGEIAPTWVADHGSAACSELFQIGNLGLQHDASVWPFEDPELLFDATDSVDRCHDPAGGGIEIIDVSGVGEEDGNEVREIHLLRFGPTTHTLTVDPHRPGIVYSNNSTTDGHNWNEVMDVRSCLTESAGGTLPDSADLETKRAECRPEVFRIPFEAVWTQGTVTLDGEPQTQPGACHDVVVEGDYLHCSGGFGEVVFDVSGLTDANGDIVGDPLPCEVVTEFSGEDTGAVVTDCVLTAPEDGPSDGDTGGDPAEDDTPRSAAAREAWEVWRAHGSPQAEGVEYLGHFNHAGPEFLPPPFNPAFGLTNRNVPSDQGVVFSHETRRLPSGVDPDREFIVVSDERGGGALPGGATCTEENFDVYGHGGLHFLDVTDPANIGYATTADGERAVWQGFVQQPMATFCVVHRFQVLEDEQRLIMGYYSQGVKILDYELDEDGNFEFTEVASMILPGANSWTTDAFRVTDTGEVDEETGRAIRTYDLLSSDIDRGIDIFSWTGPAGPPLAGAVAGVERIAGANRVETAVEVSKRSHPQGADAVVVARQDDYADALAGGPLAADIGAPILLTDSEQLSPATRDEIDRLDPDRIVLLGGENAIHPTVEAEIRARYPDTQTDRVSGPNRFATAAEIAGELGDSAQSAFVAKGRDPDPGRGWPDALAASPVAAFTNRPILLVDTDRLPAETAAALEEQGTTETVVVGGEAAVSRSVFDQLESDGHGPRRVAGATRYETSIAVLDEGIDAGMSRSTAWLATGLNWPDALAAGPAVAAAGESLLLVHGQDLDRSPAARDYLADHAGEIRGAILLGGPAAISEQVAGQVSTILGADGEASGQEVSTAGIPDGNTALLILALLVLPPAAVAGRRRRRVAVTRR